MMRDLTGYMLMLMLLAPVWIAPGGSSAPGLPRSPAALDLDVYDQPHIAYLNQTGTAVRYAHKTADGWQMQTVATATPGRELAYGVGLRVDRAGHPQLAFSDYGDLNLASWTGSSWDIQPVDHTSWVEWYISVAIDGDDQPHISYFWVTNGRSELRYARHMDGRWVVETVDQAIWIGEYNSLALDSDGAPHISYLDATHSQLKVAHRTLAGWQTEVIDGVQWPGGFTSIAIDSAGHPHVTYAGSPVGVRYVFWTGSEWQRELLASNGWYTSLALDDAGQPHMVYFDTGTRAVTYGARPPTGWRWQVVGRMAEPGRYSALALDAAGRPRIAYSSAASDELRYAWWNGDAWAVQGVRQGWQAADFPSLALDASDRPRIGFYDPSAHALRLAWGELFGQYLPLVLLR